MVSDEDSSEFSVLECTLDVNKSCKAKKATLDQMVIKTDRPKYVALKSRQTRGFALSRNLDWTVKSQINTSQHS